jgi:16S rRNA (cytosine967-C5)-methyltransferase
VRVEKPREIAVKVLQQRGKGDYLENLLDTALQRSNLKPADRGFLQELVYGVVRWELTLDWLIAQKSGGHSQKDIVQILLRLALYQMFWLERVPSYAAVNESVEICKRAGFIAQAKFINAVLRGYGRDDLVTRQRLEELKHSKPALGWSHPEWLLRRWEKQWGRAKAALLLEWNNSPPPVFARVNSLKTSAQELQRLWAEESVLVEHVDFPWAPQNLLFRLKSHPPLATLPSFEQGLFYVQDPSTLLAPTMLQVNPGDSVLDLCAAPGGKTTFIAQLLSNNGRINAQDIDPDRLKLVRENADRLGATCISTDPVPEQMLYDRILVDAPCSNTGVMRRRVELRWRIKPEEIQRLALTQSLILKTAAQHVRVGGVLVYSTCSLEREENQAVVGQFLAEHIGFSLDQERELTPMSDRVDGAYAARLLRKR